MSTAPIWRCTAAARCRPDSPPRGAGSGRAPGGGPDRAIPCSALRAARSPSRLLSRAGVGAGRPAASRPRLPPGGHSPEEGPGACPMGRPEATPLTEPRMRSRPWPPQDGSMPTWRTGRRRATADGAYDADATLMTGHREIDTAAARHPPCERAPGRPFSSP
jgi:hypothetical protein